MPKVELNLEDDELKQLLLGDRDKAMQLIMAKILDEILKSEATEQIKLRLMNVWMNEPIQCFATS